MYLEEIIYLQLHIRCKDQLPLSLWQLFDWSLYRQFTKFYSSLLYSALSIWFSASFAPLKSNAQGIQLNWLFDSNICTEDSHIALSPFSAAWTYDTSLLESSFGLKILPVCLATQC